MSNITFIRFGAASKCSFFERVEITYYGHSCFLLKANDKRIIFDPFISPNGLVEKFRKDNAKDLASDFSIDDLKSDYVLLTHGHEDHIADAEKILKANDAKLVANFEVATWYGREKGIENFHPMNHGGKWDFDFGSVKMTNAVHSSSFPDGSYAGQPGGYLLKSEGKTIYNAGDTALHYDMKIIGELESVDWALLPIGDNFTMGLEDAAIAAKWCGAKRVIGMHYDTFGYIEIDHDKARQIFADAELELTLLDIGETIEL